MWRWFLGGGGGGSGDDVAGGDVGVVAYVEGGAGAVVGGELEHRRQYYVKGVFDGAVVAGGCGLGGDGCQVGEDQRRYECQGNERSLHGVAPFQQWR